MKVISVVDNEYVIEFNNKKFKIIIESNIIHDDGGYLSYICGVFGLTEEEIDEIRYQWFDCEIKKIDNENFNNKVKAVVKILNETIEKIR